MMKHKNPGLNKERVGAPVTRRPKAPAAPKPPQVLTAVRALWAYSEGSDYLVMLIPAPNGREYLAEPLTFTPYDLPEFLRAEFDAEPDLRPEVAGTFGVYLFGNYDLGSPEDVARKIAHHCRTEPEKTRLDDLLLIAEELEKTRRGAVRRQQV